MIPNIFIIATFGYANSKLQSTLQRTISKIVDSSISYPLKEDILTFMLQKDFHLTSYRFLNGKFDAVGTVSAPFFVTVVFD